MSVLKFRDENGEIQEVLSIKGEKGEKGDKGDPGIKAKVLYKIAILEAIEDVTSEMKIDNDCSSWADYIKYNLLYVQLREIDSRGHLIKSMDVFLQNRNDIAFVGHGTCNFYAHTSDDQILSYTGEVFGAEYVLIIADDGLSQSSGYCPTNITLKTSEGVEVTSNIKIHTIVGIY